MGATTFHTFGYGKTPQEAFNAAKAAAQPESGHGGYSGTIAEKRSFRLVTDQASEIKLRCKTRIASLKADVKRSKAKGDHWEIEEFQGQIKEIGYHAKQLKASMTSKAKRTPGYARNTGDAITLADALICLCDSRVDDKWGPCGAYAVKDRKDCFLFFGWASE